MPDPSDVLRYAVRPRVVIKYLGQLAFVLALLSVVPFAASLLAGAPQHAVRYGLVAVVLIVFAALARRQRAPQYIQMNEALTVIALAFLMAGLLMTYPLMAGGLDLSDAFFESVSGITTTGLTTLPRVEDRAAAFLFGRAWLQWCGGLGFVVLLVALLMGNEIAARRLAEPYGSETMLTTTRTHARRMLGVYLSLTACGFLVMWAALGDPFAAIAHTLTSVSTGGFSIYDQSLGSLNGWLPRYAVIVVALCGAVPLPLYLYFLKLRPNLFRDTELRTLLVAVLTVGLGLTLLFHFESGTGWGGALGHGFLMGISSQTTTGYSTTDVRAVGDAAKLLMILAMFIGGGLGSTAGGIKLLRLLVVLHLIRSVIRRSALAPHAVTDSGRIGDRNLTDDDIQRTLVLVVLYVSVTLASWFPFLLYGYPSLDALFEVVSALGTVGLSTGITASGLAPVLKGVLAADMLLGRLEIVAFVVLLYPRNWFGNRVD